MKGYGQYCPIALGAEVFAERWTPIILRNLLVGCRRFGEILDGAPGLPRSVLSERLHHLIRDGVVERTSGGRSATYLLTESGRELAEVCLALGVWGARWRDVLPEHHDPYLMLWTLSRLIDPATLPRARVVVRFELTDGRTPDRYWLVLTTTGNEVCAHHPGFEEDGVVRADAAGLLAWHTGRLSVDTAGDGAGLSVTAPRWLVREVRRWGRLSPFAGIERVAG